jgi:poly-beta-1,6-N-acetyl-D-glucosamine synthase
MEIQDSVILHITFSIFLMAVAVQLYYYLRFYLRSVSRASAVTLNSKPPVSVIICARNEAANLREFLPSVLQQQYPDYEVVVVNDCSEDETEMVLSEFKSQFQHLRISTINKDPRFHHNKKLAQLIGIKAAKNEILLFTDADCRPESDQWISLMTGQLANEKDFVLGYGGYSRAKGLLNRYIRYDTMFIAMQYLGMAQRGIPYMGVGRNLVYRKSLFMKSNGFSSHYHIPSGDDDLFVNANANRANTAIQTAEGSVTWSVPCDSFSCLMKQKGRHMTTSGMYRTRDRYILVAEPATRILFYGSLILLLTHGYLWQLTLALFAARLATQIFVFSKAAKHFREASITIPSIFFDIIAPFLNSLFYLSTFWNRAGNKAWR